MDPTQLRIVALRRVVYICVSCASDDMYRYGVVDSIGKIVYVGYVKSRSAHESILRVADIVVSRFGTYVHIYTTSKYLGNILNGNGNHTTRGYRPELREAIGHILDSHCKSVMCTAIHTSNSSKTYRVASAAARGTTIPDTGWYVTEF